MTTANDVVPVQAPSRAAGAGGVSMVTLHTGGQTLMLLPEKVIFLPESDTLLVADAHIGNTLDITPLGASLAARSAQESLQVLTRLIRGLDVTRIIFLGDFLHADHAMVPGTLALVQRWRELHSALELTLVHGSRDPMSGEMQAQLDIQAFEAPLMHRGLALTHSPQRLAGSFVLGGHLHPCVSLRGRSHDTRHLPCFVFSRHVGVLPAFGGSSGMQPIRARDGERVFATDADRVFELKAGPRRR